MSRNSATASPKKRGGGKKARRLRPGELDGLVIAYLKKHKGEAPLTPSSVGKGIKRSSGAVGNCLERLARAGDVSQVSKRPRAYVLKPRSK